jgi:DNA polymerase III gamma/tau subunit
MNFLSKYKPNIIQDFIINDKLKKLINLYIDNDNINLIFVGKSGTGKTTIINCILNQYYDNLNYYDNDTILKIDNLKEESIHNFRKNIRTFCITSCMIPNKKKTIIIDDIDLIDNSIQQIIRNNMDTFSHKINFIISCTDIQNVIDNIQSRTNNIIKLTNINHDSLNNFFHKIKTNENIIIDQKSTDYLINISNNSIRILLGHVHKLLYYSNHFTIDNIKSICTNINFSLFEKYTILWYKNKNINDSTEILYKIYQLGYSVIDILENYTNFIKSTSILDDDIKLKLLPFICKYINIFYSQHEDSIELLLFTNDIIENIV